MPMHQEFENTTEIGQVQRRTAIIYDDEYLRHETGAHPETSRRLERTMDLISRDPIREKTIPVKPRMATVEEVELVHPREHIEHVDKTCQQGMGFLDADTIVSPNSYRVALLAVGGVLTGVDAIMSESVENGIALVRPPGHHAEPDRAMGFCLFNNAAIGARYIQSSYSLERIAIIDWDVHHGNGTQRAFYSDPSVLYISLHQYPLYPGTGSSGEIGEGEGLGTTLNIPLGAGSGDAEYLAAFEDRVLPKLDEYKPEFILISAGFDAHMDDPMASMNVTNNGFGAMADLLIDSSEKLCDGRLLSVLEGGYNLSVLPHTVLDHIYRLSGASPQSESSS